MDFKEFTNKTLKTIAENLGLDNSRILQSIIGERIASIDITSEKNWKNLIDETAVLITLKSGRQIRIYHERDCCEYVRIISRDGEWIDLVGKVIVDAHEEIHQTPSDLRLFGVNIDDYDDTSATLTIVTLKADDATVISRWLGESNGYYSESVDFEELKQEAEANR